MAKNLEGVRVSISCDSLRLVYGKRASTAILAVFRLVEDQLMSPVGI
jgi:hypothetical protein